MSVVHRNIFLPTDVFYCLHNHSVQRVLCSESTIIDQLSIYQSHLRFFQPTLDMMTVSYSDGVSIAFIVLYTPILPIAFYLAFRLGFSRSSGWIFLVVFALARIIGFAFQLATISNPSNIQLYEGYAILINIGLSPLMLATLGLLSHVLPSINHNTNTVVKPNHLRLVQIIVSVALILGIIGGTKAFDISTGAYTPQSESKASVVLFIAAFVAIVLATGIMFSTVSRVGRGEKRILKCVALSVPFLFARLLYSILFVLANIQTFSPVSGSETALLVMCLIMELIIVVIYGGVGIVQTREGN